jgi:hypothetical protein
MHDSSFVCLVIALVLAALASFGGYWAGPAGQPNAYYWRGGLFPTSFFFFLLSVYFAHH